MRSKTKENSVFGIYYIGGGRNRLEIDRSCADEQVTLDSFIDGPHKVTVAGLIRKRAQEHMPDLMGVATQGRLIKIVGQTHPHISLDVARTYGANAKASPKKGKVRTAALKSIQGGDSFYSHSHCNLTQLPTIITTLNDKPTITCGYLNTRTQEKLEHQSHENKGEKTHTTVAAMADPWIFPPLQRIRTTSPIIRRVSAVSQHGQKKN